ncbi:hypothetical protein Celaphus_00001721 [Cervus elaphus hippelaphus]|uniref:Uncharacterized protein n=1 Tax=Cervus elaphus hippelaphus TaxID=46360 RepID=A0A212CG70_CEREH|nr:hypothetical protein Celaphus_00001721 [Cervus elaphus hippelaphus]
MASTELDFTVTVPVNIKATSAWRASLFSNKLPRNKPIPFQENQPSGTQLSILSCKLHHFPWKLSHLVTLPSSSISFTINTFHSLGHPDFQWHSNSLRIGLSTPPSSA